MNLVFFLKTFSDLCYYGIFSAFIASFYGLTGSILPQLAAISLAAALCRAVEGKAPGSPLHFGPLLLCLPALLLSTRTAELVILVPAVAYAVFCVVSRRMHPTYYESTDTFLLQLKLLPLPALFAVVLLQLDRLEAYSLPYVLAFLLASVMLLRMLRHDEATLRQPRFRLMNGLSLAVLCLVCAFMSSALFRQGVGLVLKSLWRVVSIPVFVVAVAVGGALSLFLDFLLPDDFHFEARQLEGLLAEVIEEEEKQQMQEMAGTVEPDPTMAYVYSILGILVAIVLIVLLFRWLAAGRRDRPAATGSQTRFAATTLPPREKPLTRMAARTPALQVRYWYQQLLQKTRQEGGQLDPTMNTRQQQDVERDTFKERDRQISRLRELYLPARYKGRAGEADAKEAKSLYQQIKKS